LSSAFGFADFVTSAARCGCAAGAVAETAGGADHQTAMMRVRQNGEDAISVSLYRVDDFTGTIDGRRPDQAATKAAAAARAYQLTTGGTSINGPGYGNYDQVPAQHQRRRPDPMKLVNHISGNTYWAFAQATRRWGQHVGHLWSYGLTPGLGGYVPRWRSRLQRPDRAARFSPAPQATAG